MAVNKGSNKGGNQPTKQTFSEALSPNQQQSTQPNQPQGAPSMQSRPNPSQQGQPQSGGQQAPPRRRGSLMDINSMMSRPMSRQSTGEVVLRYQQVLKELMEANLKGSAAQEFELLVLDNNVANVGPLSSLLVCYHEQHNGRHYVAVYTLLVEGSAERLEPKTINMGNRSIAIDTVAGDVFNGHLWGKIAEHVQQTRGRQMEVLDAGAMVLPRELSHEDDMHMRMVLFNASQACFTVMERLVGGGEEPFTVELVNTSAEQLSARLSYSAGGDEESGQAETATGLPVRSDVRITLTGSLQQQYAEGFAQTRPLATVDGYVDLVYSPPQPAAPGQMPQTQHYYPRMVMTKMDTAVDAITMELQLLALAQSTLLSRQMAWAGCFRPRPNVKGLDIHDIGAVGYEIPLTGDTNAKREKVDTKSASFGINELYQLITMSVHDVLLYSMDIEEVGELSWIHQAFIAAANGDPEAESIILEAANTLTSGKFAMTYQPQQGERIAYDDQNRIHLGYYKGENGELRDIRDVDYLALLNVSGKDNPEAVIRWGETFDNRDIPLEIRLADRAELIRGMLGDNVKFKGYARRITFNPNFLISLNAACAAAGLVIRPNNLIHEFQGGTMRGNMNAGQYGVSGQAVSGLFNYSTGYGNQHQGGLANFQGHFNRRTTI